MVYTHWRRCKKWAFVVYCHTVYSLLLVFRCSFAFVLYISVLMCWTFTYVQFVYILFTHLHCVLCYWISVLTDNITLLWITQCINSDYRLGVYIISHVMSKFIFCSGTVQSWVSSFVGLRLVKILGHVPHYGIQTWSHFSNPGFGFQETDGFE